MREVAATRWIPHKCEKLWSVVNRLDNEPKQNVSCNEPRKQKDSKGNIAGELADLEVTNHFCKLIKFKYVYKRILRNTLTGKNTSHQSISTMTRHPTRVKFI